MPLASYQLSKKKYLSKPSFAGGLFVIAALFLTIFAVGQQQNLRSMAAGNTVLSFTVSLHGIGKGGDNANPSSTAPTNPLTTQRKLNVLVYNGQNTQVASKEITVTFNASSGRFQGTGDFTGLTTGPHTIKVKSPGYLQKLLPGIQSITAGQTTTLPNVSLVTGDINNDNQVSILDYNILMGCYADLSPAKSCTAQQKTAGDITDDGNVNQTDYNLFIREISNITGDQPNQQPTTNPTIATIPTNTPTLSPAPSGSIVNCGTAINKSDGTAWQCAFQDEFNGTTLSSTWEAIPYGLGSACLYDDPQHVRVTNGNLELIATKNSTSDDCYKQWGLQYTGGGIQSQGQFAQKYGRFEIRAKFPKGNGFWPAFWLLPGDDSYDGEIDIIESYGGRAEQGGDVGDFTLHVPAAGPGPQKTCRVNPDFSNGYHTYAFEWTQTSMKTYYDGVLCANFTGVGEPNGTNPPAFPATFQKPYHILLNLAVQPWWPPNSQTPMPGTMYVDYVRVWK